MTARQQPIGVGIIGLGRAGWNIHAKALRDHPGFKIAAVADPVAERLEEAKHTFSCAVYPEVEGVLGSPAVDVVVVATPSHSHVSLAQEALRRGKHVIVEKPMAQSVEEVDQMIATAESSGKLLTIYQPRRLDAEFMAIQGLIRAGRLGRLVMIRRGLYRFGRRADWQMLRKFGGGELSNTGPHLIDQLLLLLGDGPIELFADLQHTVGAGDAEDHVKLALKSASGTMADIEMTTCSAFSPPDWLILGTTGSVMGSKGVLQVKWFDPAALADLSIDEGPAAGRRYGTGEVIDWQEETLHPEQTRPQVLQFYDRFYATAREGAPLFVTPQSVRRQIEVIQRARKQTGFA